MEIFFQSPLIDGSAWFYRIIAAADVPPELVWNADDGSLDDMRVFVEQFFDFPGINVFSHADNHFFQTVYDAQIPVAVPDGYITGMEPAAGQRPGRFFRPVPVALHDISAADQELSFAAIGYVTAIFIYETRRDARQFDTDGAAFYTVRRIYSYDR